MIENLLLVVACVAGWELGVQVDYAKYYILIILSTPSSTPFRMNKSMSIMDIFDRYRTLLYTSYYGQRATTNNQTGRSSSVYP